MEFPAALPFVEAGVQRPGIARHLAAVATWVAASEGSRARLPARGASATPSRGVGARYGYGAPVPRRGGVSPAHAVLRVRAGGAQAARAARAVC